MQLLKDLQGNTTQNVGRQVEFVEERNVREFNPRGGNQSFNRDGARYPNTNGRSNNTYIERRGGITGNTVGNTDRGDSRWNQNDKSRGQRNNGPNHRINLIGIERDQNRGSIPYWMVNNRGRGYQNQRQTYRRRQERVMGNNDREIVVEEREEKRRRSPSPTSHPQTIDNPVKRLLVDQNSRRSLNQADRRQ